MSTVPQNSPRSRQSRRSTAARGIPAENSPPFSLLGIVDQEQFLTSSSSTTFSDSLSTKEASTTVAASTSLAEDGAEAQLDNNENFGAAKKPVWSKPSNETAPADVVGVVMGADSWPALSESARASPKSSSAHSLKSLSIGSITVSQELVVGSSAAPKEVNASISTPNLTSNPVVPARQKSMKRGGSSSQGSIPASDGVSQTPPVQADSKATRGGSSVQADSKATRGGSSLFRRNNSGPQPRGDSSYHHNHGRRDQERGKQDWSNTHRSFGSSHATQQFSTSQQRVGSRPFMRGPAPNAPLAPPPPPPIRPFMPPMVYTDMPSPSICYIPGPFLDPFRPMSMVPPIPQMHVNMPDPQLPSRILNQIDYYFSNENLVKDTFLRRNMDNEGWVSVNLIAGFKKVMQLTDNIQLILETIQASNVVEVQGDKLRRRDDWIKWIMPSVQTSVISPGSMNMSSQNMLAMHLNSVTLDEKAAT